GALDDTRVVEFANVDVVRHRLVTKIVKAYDAHEREHAPHADMRRNIDNARNE
ncbi:MAG: phosphate starvation-inducible protein PhoH, partial [Alphaproteobacteria bacterium]